MAYSSVFQLLLLAFLCQGSQSISWTAQSFPNPNISPRACGRYVDQSWVCDPDLLLSSESQNVIEGIIKKIELGDEPYTRAPCGAMGSLGFQIGVAVMKSFLLPAGYSPASAAESLAKAIHDTWGIGHRACDNGILVLLSVYDRQLYISAGKGAAGMLHDRMLDVIIEGVKPLLREQRYDAAVERAVVDIGLALAGKISVPAAVVPSPGSERAGAIITLLVVGGFFTAVVLLIRNGWSQQAQYNDCKAKLEKVRRDQERLSAGQTFNPTSCPICMEDFDPASGARKEESTEPSAPPLTPELLGLQARARGLGASGATTAPPASATATAADHPEPRFAASGEPKVLRMPLVLPCRHTFCEPCITAWVEQQKKTSCPVCRAPIDESEEPAPPPPPRRPCAADSYTQQDPYNAAQDAFAQPDHLSGAAAFQRRYGVGGGGGMFRDRRQRYTHQDLLRDELLFRVLTLRRRYPQYIDDGMVRTMNSDILEGRQISPQAWRDFQLRDPVVRAEAARSGAQGARSHFGGGSSHGGGGRGSSW